MKTIETSSYPWKEWVETEYTPAPFKVIRKSSKIPLIPIIVVAGTSFTGLIPAAPLLLAVIGSVVFLYLSKSVAPL